MKATRREVIKIIRIIIVTAIIIVGIVYINVRINGKDILQSGAVLESQDPQLNMLYVTHISNGEGARASEGRVNWWYDNNSGKYYLFLPASADMDKLRLGIEGIDKIYIDGIKVDNFEMFSIQEGEHVITTDSDEREYQVIFQQAMGTAAIFVDTESGSMDYINGDRDHEEGGTILILTEEGEVQYRGKLSAFHGRGNSSWEEPKRTYAFKLPKKTDLFQMGEAKKWNLIANYADKTMLRNYIVYDFTRESGMTFTPESVFVDLYTNGDYGGTYQLCEKVEVDPQRVDIPDLQKQNENVNPGQAMEELPMFGLTQGVVSGEIFTSGGYETEDIPSEELLDSYAGDTVPSTFKGYEIANNPADITGGYLMELDVGDRYFKGEAGFVTSRNQAVVLKNPQYASREQVDYIRKKYQEFEDALYDWDGINPKNGKNYDAYMDIDSFAKKYLAEEITKNLDASISSFFIYKYPDEISEKFFAGPIWDYDRAIGNFGIGYNDEDLSNPEGMYASQDVKSSTIWYAVFFRPEFHKAVLENYFGGFRRNVLLQVDEKIDIQAGKIKNSVVMDSIRWQRHGTNDENEILEFYEADIAYMKDFLSKRIAFLDEEWKEE